MSACTFLVTWGNDGRVAPRPCKCRARAGEPYCGRHALLAKRYREVIVRDGGFCIGCASPARSYLVGGVTIALCGECGKALRRAIETNAVEPRSA